MYQYPIIILSLGLVFIAPLGFYFYIFHGVISVDHSRWAEFGSYVSGIYGALAFLIIAYTTIITKKQFIIQNEDNIFFRLYESLQNRINASSLIIGEEKHTAQQVLKLVTNRFYEELSSNPLKSQDYCYVRHLKLYLILITLSFSKLSTVILQYIPFNKIRIILFRTLIVRKISTQDGKGLNITLAQEGQKEMQLGKH